MRSSLAVRNLRRRPGVVHHVMCATGRVLRQQIMFVVLLSTCTRELEVETNQEGYEELNPWFDLEARCGQV